ncbi:MAG TPA: AAA family ATPase, partial [Xanthomonadales bacterium]|nr:AAA family ATPase [Xanthomonadales bacterium]
EKAHPEVFNVFLQVFDDGRLTDRAGNTASFRHSIIILTSNLGAGSGRSGGPGFLTQQSSYSRSEVERAIQTTFRREFVNRLDRVVIFDPLTRAVMRDILHKELARVLERRGFAIRDWAVEWEASAVEFLLEKGFTPDLGARPLRRAIDQYLLAPLARTIVEHRAPRGEQFLFITSDGRSLGVRFVDPDAPVGAEAPPAVPLDGVDLKALALDPYVDAGVLALLAAETERLAARTQSDEWIARKQQAADTMQQPDFWQRPERSAVLDRLERMDRIESGIDAARSLYGRLARGKGRGASDLVRRLALQVGLMTRAADAIDADEPEDAWLELKPVETNSVAALAWRDRLQAMYLAWAEARGVRLKAAGTDRGNAVRLHASGFGAWSILRDEAGLHVLESAGGDGAARYSVRVRSASAPFAPGTAAPADSDLRIRRRYTDGPSPLVRDALGGWRSGRLDRVLGGDFDLFAAAAE